MQKSWLSRQRPANLTATSTLLHSNIFDNVGVDDIDNIDNIDDIDNIDNNSDGGLTSKG